MTAYKKYPDQRGAALVVALVLVMVSTLLGVSAMQTSDVESQLANNTLYQQAVFRAAEAGADSALTIDNIIAVANDPAEQIVSTTSVDNEINVSTKFMFAGKTAAAGYSLGGPNGFRSMKFMSDSTANIEALDSSSRVVQGVKRLINSKDN